MEVDKTGGKGVEPGEWTIVAGERTIVIGYGVPRCDRDSLGDSPLSVNVVVRMVAGVFHTEHDSHKDLIKTGRVASGSATGLARQIFIAHTDLTDLTDHTVLLHKIYIYKKGILMDLTELPKVGKGLAQEMADEGLAQQIFIAHTDLTDLTDHTVFCTRYTYTRKGF